MNAHTSTSTSTSTSASGVYRRPLPLRTASGSTLHEYTCYYCDARKVSKSTGHDGRVRILCACGGKKRDSVTRQHSKWVRVETGRIPGSAGAKATAKRRRSQQSSSFEYEYTGSGSSGRNGGYDDGDGDDDDKCHEAALRCGRTPTFHVPDGFGCGGTGGGSGAKAKAAGSLSSSSSKSSSSS